MCKRLRVAKPQATAPDQNRIVYVTAGPAIPAACTFTEKDVHLFVKLLGLHSVALIELPAFIVALDFVLKLPTKDFLMQQWPSDAS